MNMNSITLKIGGMSCMGCVNSVNRLLTQMPGVSNVSVDLGKGEAHLVFDPAQVAVDALQQTITEAGFSVTHIVE